MKRDIESHPILSFDKGKKLNFIFEGESVEAYEGETVGVALYRNGIDVFSESPKLHHPRGMFCAIGKCSSCMMRVNGVPNVRTCILNVREGMVVERQDGLGQAPDAHERFLEPETIETDAVVVGAGPAGLNAAILLKSYGVNVLLVEQNPLLGGQLIKQTHKFFGSEKEKAGFRGFVIARELIAEAKRLGVESMTSTTAFGYYPEDGILGLMKENQFVRVKPRFLVVAAGASEKMLAFPGNDIPGVFGAGAAQTLMNVFGVAPGQNVLMVGAGNVGLIVSYQLLQAGVKVAGVVEAMDSVGGYFVHAAKLRRFGVPILTNTTIKEVIGYDRVEKAITVSLDSNFKEIEDTEREWSVDTVCLSTGLIPSVNLLGQAGCELKYSAALGGFVPLRDKNLRTTKSNIFVAGDVDGIEEASTAMLEGKIASYAILKDMGFNVDSELQEAKDEIAALRAGPFARKILNGISEVELK
ncbi:MAG: FAD-dependent oxidoreductase [Caldisericaceae bacterium]